MVWKRSSVRSRPLLVLSFRDGEEWPLGDALRQAVRRALHVLRSTDTARGCSEGSASLLLSVSLMPAQPDVDPDHRPVNINAIVPKAPLRIRRGVSVLG